MHLKMKTVVLVSMDTISL